MRIRGDRSHTVPLLGAAGALIAVACCAGLPLIATVLGGLTLAAAIGVGGVALALAAALAGALLLLRTRRRTCAAPSRKVRDDG
jgi:hypothetical protein